MLMLDKFMFVNQSQRIYPVASEIIVVSKILALLHEKAKNLALISPAGQKCPILDPFPIQQPAHSI